MGAGSHTLIRLNGVKKVFLTEEVETYAVSNATAENVIEMSEQTFVANPHPACRVAEKPLSGNSRAPVISSERTRR